MSSFRHHLTCLLLLAAPLVWPQPASSQRSQDSTDAYDARRLAMVSLIRRYGVEDVRTLRAMEIVRRHEFVPDEFRNRAYGDHPLPVGHGQTISQPYIVAYMTEMLDLAPGMKVIEVGTGSG